MLDYEDTHAIHFTVNASDNVHTESKNVAVSILPVNEFDPVLILKEGSNKLKNNTLDVTEGSGHKYLGSICVDVSNSMNIC